MFFAQSTADSKIVSYMGINFNLENLCLSLNETSSGFSPLNQILFFNLTGDANVRAAKAFTLQGNFSLNLVSKVNQSFQYSIPRLINSGPIALAITYNNDSSSFTKFVMYPQIPITIGQNFEDSNTGSKVCAENYIVSCNSVLYEVVIKWSGTA